MRKYIAIIGWPEIQKYQEMDSFPDVGYDPEKNIWFVPEDMINNTIQEKTNLENKHPLYQYYTMDNCPICEFVLFYNPYYGSYFMGNLDEDNNLIIDNEIQGKVSGFNHLYWTYLPKFDKNNVINCNK